MSHLAVNIIVTVLNVLHFGVVQHLIFQMLPEHIALCCFDLYGWQLYYLIEQVSVKSLHAFNY